MTEKEALRLAMYNRKITQRQLAKLAGYKYQSSITNMLNVTRDSLRVSTVCRVFDAMGYDLLLVDRDDPDKVIEIFYEDTETNREEAKEAAMKKLTELVEADKLAVQKGEKEAKDTATKSLDIDELLEM